MPFVANTPESLVARNDSKNPSTTCRGITTSGRPCRRPITAAPVDPAQTLLPRPRRAKITHDDPRDETLYCWQHRDQAAMSAHSSPGPRGNATPILEERPSIDTLADRLGLVELEQRKQAKKKPRSGRHDGSARPSHSHSNGYAKPPPAAMAMSRPKPKKELHFCFCFRIPLDEVHDEPPARPQPKPIQQGYVSTPRPSKHHGASSTASRPTNLSTQSPGKFSTKSSKSQTGQYLSLIPDHTDPQTASALMAELARPYVDSEEAGYIYMFWMTPTTDKSPPPVDAARSLLAPPSTAAAGRQRRASDVVSSYARSTSSNRQNKKTMLLKIGRAANVQRRMQQWSRQCGYAVEVIRYYPYLPGASEASGQAPRMAPHCHRVERLVHIELAGLGLKAVRGSCDACGRDHREWFEVEATREGVRRVDEVIRRWVEWDETQP
ncbi:Meiotically up-regulated gene protein like [Verticillium longisporum]|uniref:Meiotically up-regulated gene protein like n=1 Tax=Verticillium longisporum TaxID=100787 RepID=A0A8I3APU8_VERLO|nr:Meiotically up-regulated gene protein like [Verticillium longisporum]KAG7129221.1 Meiotically up-regulated gene protein like [Verticillium longisporum]